MPPVNEADIEWNETERGQAHWRRKRLSDAAGGHDLGCSLYELPPSGTSFPYHYHTAKAEAMYVLAGTGTVRLAGEPIAIEPGDYVSFPADKRGAHKVHNDSDSTLRYLMMSTTTQPDVVVYPDSEKIGVTVEEPGDIGYYRQADAVGYWDGE